ncbi:MAG: hypothetical protein CMM87_04080 [Rickettsiales bacterium]|nr:hypothetical protein [Rickettsiales bacterium]|tara:strand:- start:37508 stop:38323 length:816 start_codon:yes stop_codon:yes gene_type:complete
MFIRHTFILSAFFLFITAYADPQFSFAPPEEGTVTRTQVVKLSGNERFLFRTSERKGRDVQIERADNLTNITVPSSVWREVMEISRKKITTYEGSSVDPDNTCLSLNAQKALVEDNTTENLTVLLHSPQEGTRTDLIHTFNLPQMLQSGTEQIKLAMLLAQNDAQRAVISEAARKAGIEWRQKATFTTQKIWARHQFEITGALYMGGFFCADLLLQKIWSYNPYAATALYGVTMSYQLWNSRHWGDFNQSTAALGALGALSFARYKGLLRF